MLDDPSDSESFIDIYEQYRGLMYKVADDILHNHENTEDALQEAFLRIAKNFSKFKGRTCREIKNYVVIISKRCALTIYQKEHTRRENVEYEELNENALVSDDVLTNIVSDENFKTVCSALENLPPTYLSVLQMSFKEKWTNDDIANMTGVEKKSIEQQVWRAKKKLTEELRKTNYKKSRVF
jgi:RNA polymerase sigma-70 factor (ECF subfamily)